MLMDAAAANKAAPDGKNIARRDWRVVEDMNGKSSVEAALAAAQRPARAEVNGRIDPALEPWLAYVSASAAALAFTATCIEANSNQ